ncbi:MAG: hypothetical protein UW69_C0077G0005 [Microgenomates group bacterium GW2011_GWA2_44_7]|nr:MAG: hypothetical protein UW69_C0077G0005 [Microgenomates group bacterium GW2011_GWA2_44_7]KKT77762.1 MAG: hypothetical protein UW73_C0012G0004 [Microgenomates group bacterium GW2011_GWB1_44_8]
MSIVILKSTVASIIAILLTLLARILFHTQDFIVDVGGLGAFVTVFGTLYGIMAAFVVFEVWGQYNTTSELIDSEAAGLERMYRMTLYLNDKQVEKSMKAVIAKYANLVIKGKFSKLGTAMRNPETGKVFREIFAVIRSIKFDDKRDPTVFPMLVEQGGKLSDTRVKRLNQSMTRLPRILKMFFYSSSLFVLLTFLIMPFAQIGFQIFITSVITFLIFLTIQLVEDLDNPFIGHFNLTPEPFERALRHIEEDY